MDRWPGIRFCPTEDEMISRNLHCKLNGTMLPVNDLINEIDIYNFDPWELRFQSEIKSRDPVWYFFVKNHGGRQKRTTISGFWKITGEPVPINDRWGDSGDAIGFKRHLTFHNGKTENKGKGEWFIDEYHNTMLPKDLRTQVMCRVRYTGKDKNMIFDNATEFSPDFDLFLTSSVVNQLVQEYGGSVNNFSGYDPVYQMNQPNWGSSSNLPEYDPAYQIQYLSENFNTQDEASHQLWDHSTRNSDTTHEDYNEYRPKDPVTRVFDDYSSESDNESTLFGDTSSSVESVGNPNELYSAPIPPLNSIETEEVKMELQGKEKVMSELECKMAEDSCIDKTPATNIEKKTHHRTPKWIYLRNKESWVVAVLSLVCVIGWTILYFVNWSLILD